MTCPSHFHRFSFKLPTEDYSVSPEIQYNELLRKFKSESEISEFQFTSSHTSKKIM